MEIIILSDGLFHLVEITKKLTEGITLMSDVDCFELCDILRLKLTDYMDAPYNRHVMKDGSGDFFGCICR